MQTQLSTTPTTPPALARIVAADSYGSLAAQFAAFQVGYDRFTAREPMSACRNSEQQRGWMAALRSEAVATLPANSADRLGF